MPEPEYKYNVNTDLYTAMYEQYYFKNTPVKRIRPLKRNQQKKKKSFFGKLISFICVFLLLCFVFPYSFNLFIKDTFNTKIKTVLKVNYTNLLYPTNNYLYKDLFLGKYHIKDTSYQDFTMKNIDESMERLRLKSNLMALANEYPKIQPAVYVWEYDGKSYVNINADEPYPAASTIKVPVLIEMFRNIDQGSFTLDDTMVLEDFYRAPGSGKLQYSEGGIAHTMDYLARIMIENSDNSSTNMIIAKMGGMPEVNRAMNRWGLRTTHINAWLPDLDGTNITTAKEMAKMFYNLDSTNILSKESKMQVADYLAHVKNKFSFALVIPT